MLNYPHIDPIAFSLFGLPVRWYGLAYVAGFFCGLWYMRYALRRHPVAVNGTKMVPQLADDLFLWIVIGIVLGGRLGYVLFYNFSHYLAHPMEIFQTWAGGMSYHGGLLGVLLAVLIFARRRGLGFFDITDRLAPGICFGIFFGRLANFINGELFGRVTSGPLGMVFPHGGPLPRHPSQLYEAALEGVLLFLILHLVLRKRLRRFEISGLFLLGYGLSRFTVEFFREPDNLPHLKGGVVGWVTMGQLLSLPMVVGGIFLLVLARWAAKK